jgi:hypothetical protein
MAEEMTPKQPESVGWRRSAQDAIEAQGSAARDADDEQALGHPDVAPRSLITSVIGLTFIWAIVALVYYVKANQSLSLFGTCGPGNGPEGGIGQQGNWVGAGYSSGAVGAFLGAALWAVAAVATWRLPRWRGPVVFAYAAIYVVALVVLWYFVSPVVWGPQRCSV